jgi:hypothetical protein
VPMIGFSPMKTLVDLRYSVTFKHPTCTSASEPKQPQNECPNLRWRPLFVSGMPILRESRDLNAETPMNLQIEKPPKFNVSLSCMRL